MGYIPPPPPNPETVPTTVKGLFPNKENPKKKTKDERFWDRELKELPPPDYDPSEDNTVKSWWNS